MNMIERISRALARHSYPGASDADIDEMWECWTDAATAAIQAMRDPTPEMKARGFDAAWNEVSADIGQVEIQTTIGQTVWHYMIDAALIDASPTNTYDMEPIDTSFGVGEG